jgi:uncharacterized coiled-coil protein SlyX
MPTLEERVAYLEGRGEEHAAAIREVRLDVRELRAEMRDLRADMNRRFDRLESRFDTKFMWLIGVQFTSLFAAIAALLNGYFR